VFIAAAGRVGLFLLVSSAMAAPPQVRAQPHLDLRAPAPTDAAEKSAAFPSAAFPSRGNPHRLGAAEQVPLPALANDTMRSRPGVQDFVRRVHQEGLPVARLFESKSALLHVGLSPRGKPGLWLVQKVH
jgi:hypothetical protein